MCVELAVEIGVQEGLKFGARHTSFRALRTIQSTFTGRRASKDLTPFSSGSDIRSNPSAPAMLHPRYSKRPVQARIPSTFSEAASFHEIACSSPSRRANRGFGRFLVRKTL